MKTMNPRHTYRGLSLIELNPVLVHEHGALAVDALAA